MSDVKLDMICTCSPEGVEEGKNLLAEVKVLLGATDADLLTRIVMDINWNHDGAFIDSIAADMWCGVSVTVPASQESGSKYRVYVECDHVEHGLAAIWKYLNDQKPVGTEVIT